MPPETDFSGPGPWDLPVRGFELARVEFAFPFDLVAAGPDARRLKVQLNGPFDYRDPHGNETHMDAEEGRWEDMVPLLALRYDTISRAFVSASSELRIEFSSGAAIAAAPAGDRYEPWEATGPGFMMVGAPSGEPAIWTGTAWDQ